MAAQEETLLSRCEIPIIDLAHIGENIHSLSLSFKPPATYIKVVNLKQSHFAKYFLCV